jgi:hypothetical protein
MSSCLWLTTLDLGGNATPVVSDCFFVHPPPPNGSWQSCNAHIQLQMCLHQLVLIDNHLMCPQGSVCLCILCQCVISPAVRVQVVFPEVVSTAGGFILSELSRNFGGL